MPHTTDHRYFWALLSASVLALALSAAPALAQDDEYDDQTQYGDQDQNDQGDYDDEDMNNEDADDADETAADDADYDQTAEAEQVEVIAPHLRLERGSMLQPTGKLTMSRAVDYSDLDLRTAAGAAELKERVRTAAGEICDTLSAIDPASSADYHDCYRQAVANAMPRANSAIGDARNYAYRD